MSQLNAYKNTSALPGNLSFDISREVMNMFDMLLTLHEERSMTPSEEFAFNTLLKLKILTNI